MEREGLEPEETAEVRLAQINKVHAEDWAPIYSPQAHHHENDEEMQRSDKHKQEEHKSGRSHEEGGLLSSKLSRPSQTHRRLETYDKRVEEGAREEGKEERGVDEQRALTLVSFNENMNLLALNAAHIFRIFDALGTESEYVSGEMVAMKGMMEELQEK